MVISTQIDTYNRDLSIGFDIIGLEIFIYIFCWKQTLIVIYKQTVNSFDSIPKDSTDHHVALRESSTSTRVLVLRILVVGESTSICGY
jgi:hypothetical protein